jgi:hypothetical protein
VRLPSPLEVMKHAEIAASYYRALVLEGLPASHAAVMAASYLREILLSDKPEIWEDDE